jgi:hypothetical protein
MTFWEWCAEIVFDPVKVIVLSMMSGVLLFIVYGLLRLVFVGI